jgi:hypothetical protein
MSWGRRAGSGGALPLSRVLTNFQARATAPLYNSAIRTYASDAKASPTEVSSILEQRIRGVQEEAGLAETGRVLSVGYASPPSCESYRGHRTKRQELTTGV